MRTRKTFALAGTALLLAVPTFGALNLEGQSGVFLNPLAYTLAPNEIETSSHYVNLDALGNVATYNFTLGVKNNLEAGFSQVASSVGGVADQNILLAKYNVVKEAPKVPAVSFWTIRRELETGDSSFDFGVTATKVFSTKHGPIIADLGVRSTKALGLGLFGIGDDRDLKFEGVLGWVPIANLTVATEFKQQIGGETWKDLALRYQVNKHLNLDAGLADLGPGIDNQVAFAVTWKK